MTDTKCPKCGGRSVPRKGREFDGERRCVSCDSTWETPSPAAVQTCPHDEHAMQRFGVVRYCKVPGCEYEEDADEAVADIRDQLAQRTTELAQAHAIYAGLRRDVEGRDKKLTHFRKLLEQKDAELADARAENERLRAIKHVRKWQEWNGECLHCGCGAEVLTTTGEDNFAYDGDEARCTSCRCPGGVVIPGDDEPGYIDWHDDPDCACDWCEMRGASDDVYALRKRAEATEATIAGFDLDLDELTSDECNVVRACRKAAQENRDAE